MIHYGITSCINYRRYLRYRRYRAHSPARCAPRFGEDEVAENRITPYRPPTLGPFRRRRIHPIRRLTHAKRACCVIMMILLFLTHKFKLEVHKRRFTRDLRTQTLRYSRQVYLVCHTLSAPPLLQAVKNERLQNARAGGRQRPGAAPAGVRPSRAGGPPAGARGGHCRGAARGGPRAATRP